jgi:hypothetical protein
MKFILDTHILLNNLFVTDFIRIFVLTFNSILLSYTLYPIPIKLEMLFKNSNLFKLFLLILGGSAALYPLNSEKFAHVIISSIIILGLFDLIRYLEKN